MLIAPQAGYSRYPLMLEGSHRHSRQQVHEILTSLLRSLMLDYLIGCPDCVRCLDMLRMCIGDY